MSQRTSVWVATGGDRPARPPVSGAVEADVAVVGAGITGLTTALHLQRGGCEVVVVDASGVGLGTTGFTTGKVTSQHTLVYHELLERHGDRSARAYAEANQQAVEDMASLVAETGAECQFERAPAYVYTRRPSERPSIEAEHAAAVRLGLPSVLVEKTDLPFPVELAVRFDEQAHFHPVRYLDALASAFEGAGGRLFEHSRATAVKEREDHAVVTAGDGELRVQHVVLATLLPFVDRGGFFAKTRPSRVYGVAARLRTDAPAGMHITAGAPTRSTRPWIDGDRRGLIVVGEHHETGHGTAGPGRWGALERWTREHFDVESFQYRWSSQDYETADGIPYVGRSPRTERTFVATGFRKWGLTNGTAAAAVLASLVQGREHPWSELFDARRIGDARAVGTLAKDNLHVGRRFVQDRLSRLRAPDAGTLQPGEGGVVRAGSKAVGAYRDPQGHLHAVEVTCTHMGCSLVWNAAETSWDCPCHGSRFSYEGRMLNAPAVADLAQVEIEDRRPETGDR